MTASAETNGRPRRGGGGLAWLVLNWLMPISAAYALVWIAAHPHRKPLPGSPGWDPRGGGTIHVRLKLPGTEAGIPEPVLVYGVPGKAALIYVRLLEGSRARIGVEYWGIGATESPDFPLSAPNATIDVGCALPEFFRAAGDRSWGEIPAAVRAERLSDFSVTVDGVVRLENPSPYALPVRGACTPGANRVGGSLVTGVFSGKVLSVSQSR